MRHSSALRVAWVSLRILVLLNWLSGAAILALLSATVVAEQWTFTALGITPSSGIPSIIMGLRAIALLGLVGIVLNNAVLKRLLTMVDTVRRGDPFVAANADRLQAIGWALLALQLLSLVIAGIGKVLSTPDHPRISTPAFRPAAGWQLF